MTLSVKTTSTILPWSRKPLAACRNMVSTASQSNSRFVSVPYFTGLTNHIKQQDRWFSTETMYRLLGIPYCIKDRFGKILAEIQTQPAYSTAYLGKLPTAMAVEKNLPPNERCTPHQWLQRIEDFAASLRHYNLTFTKEVLIEDLSRVAPERQWTPLTALFVDRANYGAVYRVTYKGKDFALKVFHAASPELTLLAQKDSQQQNRHGPVAEATANLNLSRYGESCVPMFDLANPKAGWILREFIDPAKSYAHRTGSNCKPLPFVSSDARSSEQYVHDILVDLGGAESTYLFKSVDAFLDNLKNPFTVEKTIRSFSMLSVPMKEEALTRAGQEGLVSPRLLDCFDYYNLDLAARSRIAKAWMETPENWPILCNKPYVIPPQDQLAFIQQAIERSDCHGALMQATVWGLSPEAKALLQQFRIQVKEKKEALENEC